MLKRTLKRVLKDLKSNSYSWLLLSTESCNVRLENRPKEFPLVARLTKGSRSESEYENALVTGVRPEAR